MKHIKLSKQEYLTLVGIRLGKSNVEIANMLDVNRKTSSTYKYRIKEKLNVVEDVQLLIKAKELNLIS